MSILPKNIDKAMPTSYMKFKEGDNKIRVLESSVSGYVYWTFPESNKVVPRGDFGGKGSKPHRVADFSELDSPQRNGMKPFIAMVVYNYNEEGIQILEITQSGVMNSLDALSSNEKWGSLKDYDVTIRKTKTGPDPMNVEYSSILPDPKEPVSDEIKAEYKEKKIDMNIWFSGYDPFDIDSKGEIKVVDTPDLDGIDLDDLVKEVDKKSKK